MFKIATWNVNSLRVRLPHVLQWIEEAQPDVLALQETKVLDEQFPLADIKAAGYECLYSGQATYNGMAILSKQACLDKITDFPELIDPQRRILAVTLGRIRILNVYIPNGESVTSPKYTYKLDWLQHLDRFLQDQIKQYPDLIILGDFNIAPEDIDVHDPLLWEGKVLFSDKEKQAFRQLLANGLVDCFRIHPQPDKSFSWWDYRMNAYRRNLGLRIDHLLATTSLAHHCSRCYIDKTPRTWERPSDHTPVIAEFDL